MRGSSCDKANDKCEYIDHNKNIGNYCKSEKDRINLLKCFKEKKSNSKDQTNTETVVSSLKMISKSTKSSISKDDRSIMDAFIPPAWSIERYKNHLDPFITHSVSLFDEYCTCADFDCDSSSSLNLQPRPASNLTFFNEDEEYMSYHRSLLIPLINEPIDH